MKRLNISVFFLACLAMLVIKPSDLQSENLFRGSDSRHANFLQDPRVVLDVSPMAIGKVLDAMYCALQCLSNARCWSFNVKIKPDADNKFDCQLLSTDKYNSSHNLKSSKEFDYHSLLTSCGAAPCQNGGTCRPVYEKQGYECECLDGFRGTNCQHLEVKLILPDSKILKGHPDYDRKLSEYLAPVQVSAKKWTLCFRASEHQFKAAAFHAACDNKGPTVTVIRVGVNVFGGYADKSWDKDLELSKPQIVHPYTKYCRESKYTDDQAKDQCTNENKDLAIIRTDSDFDDAARGNCVTGSCGKNSYWIGLKYDKSQGSFYPFDNSGDIIPFTTAHKMDKCGEEDKYKCIHLHIKDDNSVEKIHCAECSKGEKCVICQNSSAPTTNGVVNSTAAFLFSLKNQINKQYKMATYQNANNDAINSTSFLGPSFSSDLQIADSCHANTDSFSELGSTYEPPNGFVALSAEANKLLAGSKVFKCDEYEVFYQI